METPGQRSQPIGADPVRPEIGCKHARNHRRIRERNDHPCGLGTARDQETCSQKHSLARCDGEGQARLLQVQEQADGSDSGKVSEQTLDLQFEFFSSLPLPIS